MTKKYLFAAGIAATAAVMPVAAQAQDNDDALTGFRVELVGGIESLSLDGDIDGVSVDANDEAFLYGVGIGYDFSIGGIIVGIEAEYSDSKADFDFGPVPIDQAGFERIGTDGDAYVGLRIGAPVGPRTLIYAKGGLASTEVEIESAIPAQTFLSELDDEGYRVGAGIEHSFGTKFFAKAEYRYTDYGSALTIVEDAAVQSVFENGLSQNQFVVGLGLRF